MIAPRPSRPRLLGIRRSAPTQPVAVAPAPSRDELTAPASAAVSLESHTPRYLAEKILSSRAALEGERKQVTVLFADVKGSTEVIQSLDAEDGQQLLDGVVKAMMGAVHHYEGTVNHILGDGIMALFGAPIAHEDHAVRACYAALAMQEAINRYGEETRERYGFAVKVRVGLNSGEVIVRAIANDLRMDYSAMGQTVHLAARMEQNAPEGGVLLTPAVVRLVEGYVDVRPVGPLTVKGVAEPIEAFELIGAGPIRTRLQASAARGLTSFVGREAELRTLLGSFEQAATGHGQVIALVGDPGMGKSRLVWEAVHSRLAEDWLILESASVAYGKGTLYLPVIELLKIYFQIEIRDDEHAIREKVSSKALDLDGSLEPILPALLALLDVEVADPEWRSLDPPQRRRRTHEAVIRLLLCESERQPVLLIVENLHWIDAETRALLVNLIERMSTTRLALLATYRPEYQPDWEEKAYSTEIRLHSLSPEGAQELLGALLGHDPTLDPLKALLAERTQGNPFFLEESVRSLIETGALVGEPGAYRLTQALTTIRVPATVQSVLAARIDRLQPEDKWLLQCAAVIGTDVPFGLLVPIVELPEDELREALSHLQRADFLVESSLFPETEYAFKHALTHSVAYDSLLQQRRRTLHSQVVETIETFYSDRLAEHVEHLAHHAFSGEVWPKAVTYYRQAAAKAVTRAAYRPAISNLERALQALERLPDSADTHREGIDIRLELRSSLLPLGELQRIHDYLVEAERLALTLGDPPRQARVFSYLCAYFSVLRDPDQAVPFGQRAVALAGEVGDLNIQVPASFFLGEALYSLGDYRQGAAVLQANAELLQGDRRYERFGMTGLPAGFSYGLAGACLAELGEFAEAAAAAHEAVQIAEAVNHPFTLAHACTSDGFVHLMKGDLDRAARSLDRSAELCRTWSFSIYFANSTSRLGYAQLLAGRLEDGLRLLEQAARQAESVGRLYEQASILGWLAEAYLLSGRPEQSLEAARRAFEIADQSRQRGKRAHALRILAEIDAESGPWRTEQADGNYREALSLAEELGMRPLQAHCHFGLGTLYRRAERVDDALSELTTAIELYDSMGMTLWLGQSKAEFEACALGTRDPVAQSATSTS
jgi:class 3 adenylate cyclase/tetratricopeptide (TPR) repeat protein